MKFLKQAKDMLSLPKIRVTISVPRVIDHTEKKVEGSVTMMSTSTITITSLTLNVIQSAKIPTKKEGRTDVIGKKLIKLNKELTLLEKEKVLFTIPISRKAAKAVEKKVYHGDMALLNKVSDKAKKTLYHYTLEVTIKCKDSKEPIVKTTTLTFSDS